jgi:glucosamine-6-phosphate deaminase
MKLTVLPDAGQAAKAAASRMAEQIRSKPKSVLGLATGGTMEPVYEAFLRHETKGLDLTQIRSFNLDEYIGLPADHPQSYHRYMQEHLLDHIGMDAERSHIPNGLADPTREARRYEAALQEQGPVDLQLLGLGRNGHIGFNEPGSPFSSLTRAVDLAESTRESNKRFFKEGNLPPERAITMGIATILRAQHIVLLAVGEAKAEAVARMVAGEVTEEMPASVLQGHAQVEVLLDPAAAQGLQDGPIPKPLAG